MVVTKARELLKQLLEQRDDCCINDEDLTELIKPSLKTVTLVLKIIKCLFEELSKELTELRREPLVE